MRRYKKQISRIVTVAMLFAFLVGNSNMVSVILQEYTSIIGANSFKGVEKIAAGMYW